MLLHREDRERGRERERERKRRERRCVDDEKSELVRHINSARITFAYSTRIHSSALKFLLSVRFARFRFYDKYELDPRSRPSEDISWALSVEKWGLKNFLILLRSLSIILQCAQMKFHRKLKCHKWPTWPLDLNYCTSRFNTLISLIKNFMECEDCKTLHFKLIVSIKSNLSYFIPSILISIYHVF